LFLKKGEGELDTMSTTLPRLAPGGTSITTFVQHHPVSSIQPPKNTKRVMPKLPPNTSICKPSLPGAPTLNNINIESVYNPFPAKMISSVDNSDFTRLPQRINPLQPPAPYRRTVMWETIPQHYENEKRSNLMQKMHHMRYHTAYQKYPYGSPAEKEIYRRLIREGLKEQMTESDLNQRQALKAKVIESEVAVQTDRKHLQEDAQKHLNHFIWMTEYRDANKTMMENRWKTNVEIKKDNQVQERECLRYNPINWSHTLK